MNKKLKGDYKSCSFTGTYRFKEMFECPWTDLASFKKPKPTKEWEQTLKNKAGLYFIMHDDGTAWGFRKRGKIPLQKLIYIGQAGGRKQKGKGSRSTFNDRIPKHALKAVGVTSNQKKNTAGAGIADTKAWKGYRESMKEGGIEYCLENWWIALVLMPNTSERDMEKIEDLENSLIMTYAALSGSKLTKGNLSGSALRKVMPRCNTSISLGTFNQIFRV